MLSLFLNEWVEMSGYFQFWVIFCLFWKKCACIFLKRKCAGTHSFKNKMCRRTFCFQKKKFAGTFHVNKNNKVILPLSWATICLKIGKDNQTISTCHFYLFQHLYSSRQSFSWTNFACNKRHVCYFAKISAIFQSLCNECQRNWVFHLHLEIHRCTKYCFI